MRFRMIAAVIVLAASTGCTTVPAAKNPAVSRYQRGAPERVSATPTAPPPKTSLLGRFRLSRLWDPDEKPTDVTAVLPKASRAEPPVVLIPPAKSDLVLPAATDDDEHPDDARD